MPFRAGAPKIWGYLGEPQAVPSWSPPTPKHPRREFPGNVRKTEAPPATFVCWL